MANRMEEVSVIAAVEKLKGRTVTERSEGLETLTAIFSQDGLSRRINKIGDDSFHNILESLFEIVKSEKPRWIKATTASAQNKPGSRLSNAAKALRIIIKAVGDRLKHKTASAVLDHITDTLPCNDGKLCTPIQRSYLEIFNILLSHSPRIESLRPKQWQKYVDFVLETVNECLTNPVNREASASLSFSRQQSTNTDTELNVSHRFLQSSTNSTSQQKASSRSDELAAEELLVGLKYLTSSTNAPIVLRLREIMDLVVHWLSTVLHSEELAFEVLNYVLPTALTEDVRLAATAFESLCLAIRQRDLWSKKSDEIRENILATMILCRSMFSSLAQNPAPLAVATLEHLLDLLRADYTPRAENEKRPDPDRLSMDHLGFSDRASLTGLSVGGVNLVSDTLGVVNNWATLMVIASLLAGISRKRDITKHSHDENGTHKRVKLTDPVQELFQLAIGASASGRLVSLQLALFLVDLQGSLSEMTIDQISGIYLADIEDEPMIAAWICLLLARIASLDELRLSSKPDFWKRIWSWATRATMATATTRPACYLLYAMTKASTIRLLITPQMICEGIFPDGVSGPNTLSDAAVLLLTGVLKSGLLDTDKMFKLFGSHVLRWIDSQWTISTVPDRIHNAHIATSARSDNLYALFMAVGGIFISLQPLDSIPSSANAICRAMLIQVHDLSFTEYMLSDKPSLSAHSHTLEDEYNLNLPSLPTLNNLQQAVIALLTSKAKSFFTACKTSSEDASSPVNLDVIETATTLCVLVHIILKSLGSAQDWLAVQTFTIPFWELILHHLEVEPKTNFTKAFARIAMRLTSIQVADPQDKTKIATYRAELCSSLNGVRRQFSESQQKIVILDPVFTDSFEPRASQSSQKRSLQTVTSIVRSDLALSNDIQTCFIRQRLFLDLDMARAKADADPQISFSTVAIKAIVALEAEALLCTRDIILEFLDSDIILTRADSALLLTKLAKQCLDESNIAKCEAALCFCLRVATGLAPLWVVDQEDDLADVGYDIYQWYVNIALGKGVGSQRVLLSIASLLDSVIHCNQSYATDSIPSARTSLLQILKLSQTGVKFQLVGHLSNLFNGYVLGEHPAVLDDVIDELPNNPDDYEGIVLRLCVISCLGAQWHTILRQSIYHIFETAANVPTSVQIATKCVRSVCSELKLETPEKLLRLFSPQVFYTWLENYGMTTIPFLAFGYNTLAALQVDLQDEIIAQIAMRTSAEHAQSVVQSLGVSWDSLIQRWFAKVVAYAILLDVSVSRSSREIGKAEMSLVQQLGDDTYADLCRTNFAKAVSTLLLRLSDDRGFEKATNEAEASQQYATTYKLICSRSSSEMQLPPAQQPSFRAKHLVHILDRLCMRAGETLESIWTPALLVHVYRSLLADAKPAFGPLHSCAILRKIRVVICLAGSVALSGYPLQMLLRALRPFLTQFHSSEDAFGIFWYLLEHGKSYLKKELPFVTGLSVSIFASLSRFASSSQESTTQESHFLSTMTKAQEFKGWLGKYLGDFRTTNLDNCAAATFANIVQAAKQITKAGSSAKTTAEGSLLYHLLADQASGSPLLSNTFFHLTLRSLCHDFNAATDFQDDILYSDKDVLLIAPVLWSVVADQKSQSAFCIWGLQALGRAYSLQGPTVTEFNRTAHSSPASLVRSDVVVEDSYQSIVNALGDLLWSEDETSASAAEATLQSILTALPTENKAIVLGSAIDQSMFDELRFTRVPCPAVNANISATVSDDLLLAEATDSTTWASSIVKKLSQQQINDPVLSFLPAFIDLVPEMAPVMLPHVVHLALYLEVEQDQKTKDFLTMVFGRTFDANNGFSKHHVQMVLKTIIHLRRCALPSESSMAKRNSWLAIDFGAAATAALRYELYRMALLMLEIHVSQYNLNSSRTSRRMSHGDLTMVPEVLAQIYQNVDDPDFFYGTHEESDVASIVEKLCHEGHGYKALSFQSALFDSNIRTRGMSFALSSSGTATMSVLNLANLSGLSTSTGTIIASSGTVAAGECQDKSSEYNLKSLLNLHQWDVTQDRTTSDHGTVIMTPLKALSSASHRESIITATDQNTLELAQLLLSKTHGRTQRVKHWTSLAVLAEMKETLSVKGPDDLESLLSKRSLRRPWTEQESFECVEPILLGREAMFATIKTNAQLRNMVGITAPQAILLEIKALRTSLSIGHVHEMSQFCLNRAAYLSELLPSATELGVKVEAAIQYDLANTFWAQQESAASIRILQNLHERELPDQAIEVQQSEILTDLGSKITEARLDRPDEVTAKYLLPAIKALGKETMGSKVGRVFHNFAAFCDSQLRDPDNVDEYDRVEKIRDRKSQEVTELEDMYKKGDAKTKDMVRAHFAKAKTWFKLDDEELQRLKAHRERLVRNCLENYLLSLRACQDFPNDVLRFLALWMEQSSSEPANSSVKKYLSEVPTYKFAPLMNQLSSRILNDDNEFQKLLSSLIYHICEDHPFHSLHQIFATSKSKGAQKDAVANSRHAAATALSEKVMKKSSASNLWVSIHNSNIQFVRVAQEKIPDKELKTGSKLLLRKLPQGAKLEQTISDMHHKIPPPTMKVEIRPDKDYSGIATIARFDPQISIAGGVSAPKIITIIAGDGSRHKMLLKGGNDDLRQDSIMEQVFEQVSNLLKDHRPTRQRKLGIRTYKVIPLTHNAGIIEFVRDTMPLHDYVLPAHTRYYPKDYKPNKCRKEIADAQSKSQSQRLQAYQKVVANFHPVMRFFFMEHFLDPDDWFQKRLNYSRSTASISMLGHVLGLGDRHGHNILLDTKTGEVVHIDLGVAFEAGRVLPVPEVVPFRLTRDLVDGMGLSGVEGVFRRCCNFTLEALRRNQEAIMTILDVLRWDPLYSWSVSPLRLARMQENQEQAANADVAAGGTVPASVSDVGTVTSALDGAAKRNVNEPSEADRALAVVSKKLGKSLSVEATVNELIRQAMDEKRLAVLYCGWAAYA